MTAALMIAALDLEDFVPRCPRIALGRPKGQRARCAQIGRPRTARSIGLRRGKPVACGRVPVGAMERSAASRRVER